VSKDRISLPWFRVYADIVDDEKLRLLAYEDRWHFVALLACKAQGILDIEASGQMIRRRVAVKLGVQASELDEVVRRISEVGLISKKNMQPTGWDSRQFLSDHSKERTRKYRENKETSDVTTPSLRRHDAVTVTPPDTDTDTDTEKSIYTPLPPEGDDPKFEPLLEAVDGEAWSDFDAHRKSTAALKKNWTPLAKTKAQALLAQHTPAEQREMVDSSIRAGWSGLFARTGGMHETHRHVDNSAPARVKRANERRERYRQDLARTIDGESAE